MHPVAQRLAIHRAGLAPPSRETPRPARSRSLAAAGSAWCRPVRRASTRSSADVKSVRVIVTDAIPASANSMIHGIDAPSSHFGNPTRVENFGRLVLVRHRNVDPPWMKPVAAVWGVVGEVGLSMVRASPRISWTRGLRAPPIAPGSARSRSALFRLPIQGCPAPAARREGEPWRSSIRAAPASTSTRRPWSPPCAWPATARSPRGPHLRHHHRGPARAVGVAGRERLHPRRDGGDRRLLEAGLAHPRRRRVRADPGQRRAGQERARPQDRRQRRALAGRAAGARPDPRQLRAGGADAGAALACCAPASSWCASGRATCCGCRRRSRTPTQARRRRADQLWARAAGRCSRPSIDGESDPGQAGAPRPTAAQGDAGAAAGGAARAGDGAPPLPAAAAPATRSTRWTRPSTGSTAEVEAHLDPFRAAVELLASIPGVGALAAQVIVAEIGLDMGRFPTAGHLDLLGRAVPEQRRERRQAPLHPPAQGRAVAQDHARAVRLGGQPQEGQLPAGPVPPPARPARAEEGDLRRRRLDPDRRLPHAQDGTVYPDLGPDHFRRTSPESHARRLARQIAQLGFVCTITPATEGAVSV